MSQSFRRTAEGFPPLRVRPSVVETPKGLPRCTHELHFSLALPPYEHAEWHLRRLLALPSRTERKTCKISLPTQAKREAYTFAIWARRVAPLQVVGTEAHAEISRGFPHCTNRQAEMKTTTYRTFEVY